MRRVPPRPRTSLPAATPWLFATLFHFGYAAQWGALYAMLHEQRPTPPLVGGPLLAALIYALAFSPWGAATQTGTERPAERRSNRETLLHWTAALSFAMTTAYAYRWLRRRSDAARGRRDRRAKPRAGPRGEPGELRCGGRRAGPNGLAAAIVLARAGRSVLVREAASEPGGGVRSEALTLPGYIHDVCSAVYPLGIASPLFRRLPLPRTASSGFSRRSRSRTRSTKGTAVLLERSTTATAHSLGRTRRPGGG